MGLFKNWKPKTVAGKILKGTTIGVLGVGAVATGVGAVAGAVGGAGLLAGAASGVGTLVKGVGKVAGGGKTVLSKVSASAVKLVTGESKEERAILKEVKDQAKQAKEQNEFIQKLVKAGLSEKEAYAKLGLTYPVSGDEKTESGIGFLAGLREQFNAETETVPGSVKMGGNSILWIAAAGLGLLLLVGRK